MPGAENRSRDRKSVEITAVTAECDLQTVARAAAVYKISHKVAWLSTFFGSLAETDANQEDWEYRYSALAQTRAREPSDCARR